MNVYFTTTDEARQAWALRRLVVTCPIVDIHGLKIGERPSINLPIAARSKSHIRVLNTIGAPLIEIKRDEFVIVNCPDLPLCNIDGLEYYEPRTLSIGFQSRLRCSRQFKYVKHLSLKLTGPEMVYWCPNIVSLELTLIAFKKGALAESLNRAKHLKSVTLINCPGQTLRLLEGCILDTLEIQINGEARGYDITLNKKIRCKKLVIYNNSYVMGHDSKGCPVVAKQLLDSHIKALANIKRNIQQL